MDSHDVIETMTLKQGNNEVPSPDVTVNGATYNFGVVSYTDSTVTFVNKVGNGNYVDSTGRDFAVAYVLENMQKAWVGKVSKNAYATIGSDTSFTFNIPVFTKHTTIHQFYKRNGNVNNASDMVSSKTFTDVSRDGDSFKTIDKYNTTDFTTNFETIENGPTGQFKSKYEVGKAYLSGVVNSIDGKRFEYRRYNVAVDTEGNANVEIRVFDYNTGEETTVFKTVKPLAPGEKNTIQENAIQNPQHPYDKLIHRDTGLEMSKSEAAGDWETGKDDPAYYWYMPERGLTINIGNTLKPAGKDTVVKYKLSDVVVHYVNTKGETIKEDVDDTKDTFYLNLENGNAVSYDTTDNKPTTITKDGKLYRLVSADGSDKISYKANGTKEGSAEENANLPYGSLVEVTYVYEEIKGNVNVHYVNTDNEKIAESVKPAIKDEAVGTKYNTSEKYKPETITTNDGKVYELVKEAGKSDKTSWNKDATRTDSDPEEGTVKEEDQDITYVYQLVKGNVKVHYVNTDGETISKSKDVKKDADTGESYNTDTKEFRPNEIKTDDGKTYRLVQKSGSSDNIKWSDRAVKDGSDPESGTVKEETQNITYVYELVKGNVVVRYEDTEGNELQDPVEYKKDAPVGEDYNTDEKKDTTITKDGKTYKLVTKEETGKWSKDAVKEGSDKVKGTVEEGTPYDTTSRRHKRITYKGKTYEVTKVVKGNEKGNVVEGDTEVTYVYKLVKEVASTKVKKGVKTGDATSTTLYVVLGLVSAFAAIVLFVMRKKVSE